MNRHKSNQMMCAIYARVSDESQVRGESIDHQIAYAKAFLKRRAAEYGEEWVTSTDYIFVDEGITGTSMLKRPAVQSLLQTAKGGAFQAVVFKGISRFARDTIDALTMLRTFIASGIRVMSLEENYDSARDKAEFLFTIHSALAQAESEKIGIRVRLGAFEKARTGRWNGRPPDGYWLNPTTQRLEIDEAMAPTIRQIFRWYLEGAGTRTIAWRLNDMGVRTKQGNPFSQRQVSRVLKNPVYVGDVVYGRRVKRLALSSESAVQTVRRSVLTNDEDDMITVENAHPAIIARADFEEVARTFQQRKVEHKSSRPRPLGQGLLRCGCGAAMTVKYNGRKEPYYRCSNQSALGKSTCLQPYVPARDLEQVVLSRVQRDFLACLPSQTSTDTLPQPVVRALEQISNSLSHLRLRQQRVREQLLDGNMTAQAYGHHRQLIDDRERFLHEMTERLRATHAPDESQLLSTYEILHFLVIPDADVNLQRAILTSLVANVQIVPSADDALTCVALTYTFQSGK